METATSNSVYTKDIETGVDISENTFYKQELNRTLTFKDLIIYGLITMLPIAPIEVYGLIAKDSFGMVPFVYLIGLIAMLFTAMSYSKLSNEFPIAGSGYSFVQRGLNPHIGFITGWLITIDYIIVPALLFAFSGAWLSAVLPSVPSLVWVIIFVAICTFVNVKGITLAAKTNTLFLILEFLALFMFIGFAIKYVFIDGNGAGGFSMKPFFQAGKVDLKFTATAASIAVLGFIGFDVISTLSEEVKNPKKTVGKATVTCLFIIGFLFIFQAYMAALVHPSYEGLDPNMAFFDIAKEAGGSLMYYVLLFVGVVAVGIANALAVQSAISRVLFSMGRDKLVPFSNFLGKVHPIYQTPANATIFIGAISILISAAVSLDTIIRLVNFGALITYMVVNLTVFVHFFIRKNLRSFSGWISYALFPFIGFTVLFYCWSGFDRMTYIVGFVWTLIGVIIGYVKSKGYKELPPTMREI